MDSSRFEFVFPSQITIIHRAFFAVLTFSKQLLPQADA
ncbi:hypothetical protein ABI_03780 [Asticcacaulis biprosthecium C19]|uniref:Uncharacterized protein n=1 Tax=Asticcacaulis biprosthecium C19 TaxID=715226 RepID=F4QJJ5_9CAUL|nr:hypothetical protein ABI_03780 [Asticcacaulis biprosthecium C19]